MGTIKLIFKSFIEGPVYLVLFGLLFFGIGAGLRYQQFILERNGEQAQGEVIRLSENCDSDGCTYAPVVKFTTRDGITVTFKSTYSSSPPAHRVGESVTVMYLPASPEKAEIKGEGSLFRVIFMIAGGGVILFGLAAFIRTLRGNLASV